MFAADVKIKKEKAPIGPVYRGQGVVTAVLAALSLATLVWSVTFSFDQAHSLGPRAGLEEVRTIGSSN